MVLWLVTSAQKPMKVVLLLDRNGDTIRIDAIKNEIHLDVDPSILTNEKHHGYAVIVQFSVAT